VVDGTKKFTGTASGVLLPKPNPDIAVNWYEVVVPQLKLKIPTGRLELVLTSKMTVKFVELAQSS
jgi:nucleoid-associated protein YgaU